MLFGKYLSFWDTLVQGDLSFIEDYETLDKEVVELQSMLDGFVFKVDLFIESVIRVLLVIRLAF